MRAKKALLVVFMFMFCGYVYGQFAGDGGKQTVVGTDHDLHTEFAGGTAVCDYCHVPHKFNVIANQPPLLWNVQVKPGPYATYSSSSFDGAGTIRDPSAASGTKDAAYMTLLCLSCHDGTITQASFYQVTPAMGGAGSVTAPVIGGPGGLSNDHPVDFVYSVTLATADGGLKSPTEGTGVRIPYVGTLPLFKDQPSDVSGRLECATCHNPHNDSRGKFLRITDNASSLCLTCHGL
ncbi:MAG: cytochrome c3 family protein [Acidobacteriota bacterium]